MAKQTVVIIGAGSTGLSTAIKIAKNPQFRVIVIDKNFAGSGQTGQCCGFVRSYYNSSEMIQSAFASLKIIKSDADFVKTGLLIIEDVKQTQKVKSNVELLTKHGVTASLLTADEISKINPYISSAESCSGFDQTAGYVNPHLVISKLLSQCLENKVTIRENEKVTSITRENGEYKIKTNNSLYSADKIFNATAAYTNSINHLLGFDLPIKAIKINNAFYRLPIESSKFSIAIADFVNGFYLIPRGEFIDVSSMVLDLDNTIDPNTENLNFSRQIVDEYLHLVSKRIPIAERSAKLGGFSSCIDISPDYYPIISRAGDLDNYFVATGFSGTGFKHYPTISDIASGLIMESETKSDDLKNFFDIKRLSKLSNRNNVSDSYFVKDK